MSGEASQDQGPLNSTARADVIQALQNAGVDSLPTSAVSTNRRDIIRGWSAHGKSAESLRVNADKPELWYARALHSGLAEIGRFWRRMPIEDVSVFSGVRNGLRTFDLMWSQSGTDGSTYRISASYEGQGRVTTIPDKEKIMAMLQSPPDAVRIARFTDNPNNLDRVLDVKAPSKKDDDGYIQTDSDRRCSPFNGVVSATAGETRSIDSYVNNVVKLLEPQE